MSTSRAEGASPAAGDLVEIRLSLDQITSMLAQLQERLVGMNWYLTEREGGLATAHGAALDREAVVHRINYTNDNLYRHLSDAARVRELYYRDLMVSLDRAAQVYPPPSISFQAELPVAIGTDDHIFPWGTAYDNTRSPRFVRACERRFNRPLTFLDLGCSGGGVVLDFILRAHRGYGVEGSDYSQRAARSEWRVLTNNLFTADITRRFTLTEAGTETTTACDVISAWEVMEHIADEELPGVFDNVARHLKPDGIFIGSVTTIPDGNAETGAVYHRTVEQRDWWVRRFTELGFEMLDEHEFAFEDFCRGTGNGPHDPDFRKHPDNGFHYVSRRIG